MAFGRTWTPSRTRFSSTRCCPRATRPGKCGRRNRNDDLVPFAMQLRSEGLPALLLVGRGRRHRAALKDGLNPSIAERLGRSIPIQEVGERATYLVGQQG